jgi:ABC-type anion transport system duplicated permease subunit
MSLLSTKERHMGRLIIEILIVMVISSLSFVLGLVFGYSAGKRDRLESITQELMNRANR